jgi:uncharacterized membrane protein YgcG
VHVIAGASPDNTPAGYYWTFLFPMLLFIVIALILWALFGRPHQRVPARRITLGLSSPGAAVTAAAATAAVTGGVANGGAAKGGASNGGASNGGASNGGASNGGAPLAASAEPGPSAGPDETDGLATDGAGASE